ncbi:MAG: AmmeMemoRadiSam system protein B [bacterium]|nr:AmmeMemoRadiSam system protein B [bacterium]
MTVPSVVRKSAVAGTFYPGDSGTLKETVDELLASIGSVDSPGPPKVLLSPHAGYLYSGPVAAHGFNLLRNHSYDAVVIVGPSHMEHFPFVSVFDGDAYETPLGLVPVDHTLASTIASGEPGIRASDRGHIQDGMPQREHGLEVQLPFLQRILGDFEIVPIVMGDQGEQLCMALGRALSPILKRPGVLVVVSSDLSHFHSYDAARNLDSVFCDTLLEMKPQRLLEFIRSGRCEACGAGPVVAALAACAQAGLKDCRVLHKANSGDVTGDRQSVVGYASAAIF